MNLYARREYDHYEISRELELKTIEPMIHQIINGYHPDKIMVFGSYASGEVTQDSDVDILILKECHERPVERRQKVLHLLKGSDIPKDIFVMTRKEFESTKDIAGTIAYEARHFGKLVYG
jgi:predicted nucleotidyltransferase